MYLHYCYKAKGRSRWYSHALNCQPAGIVFILASPIAGIFVRPSNESWEIMEKVRRRDGQGKVGKLDKHKINFWQLWIQLIKR